MGSSLFYPWTTVFVGAGLWRPETGTKSFQDALTQLFTSMHCAICTLYWQKTVLMQHTIHQQVPWSGNNQCHILHLPVVMMLWLIWVFFPVSFVFLKWRKKSSCCGFKIKCNFLRVWKIWAFTKKHQVSIVHCSAAFNLCKGYFITDSPKLMWHLPRFFFK